MENSFDTVYPWPFLICGGFLVLFTVFCIICRKETKFRETAVALVAWPELISWVAFVVLQDYYYGITTAFAVALLAIITHVVINIIYGLVH